MAEDPARALDRILETAAAGGDPGPCPDENVLAALAEGGLPPSEREAAVGHLVRCRACRDGVRALLPHVEAARPAGRLLRLPRRLAVAASLLLALGAAVLGATLLSRPQASSGGGGAGDSAAALEVAAARLAREAPAEFGGFRPLAFVDLRAATGDALRGAQAPASPSGRILEARPTLRWGSVAGARTYRVTLLGPEGVLWERTTSETSLPWPADAAPLAPGARAAWTVTANDPHATSIERAIALLEDAEVARWRRTEAAASSVEEPLRWLVLAHAALRQDLPAEALAHASRYAEARPGDPLGDATRAAAAARLSAR